MSVTSVTMIHKKFALLAATLMLALGFAATSVSTAQAGHRDGRIVAGVIAGAALLAIIANERRHKKRSHRHHSYHRDYDRGYHIHHNKWGEPYRCSRRHGYRSHRGDHW